MGFAAARPDYAEQRTGDADSHHGALRDEKSGANDGRGSSLLWPPLGGTGTSARLSIQQGSRALRGESARYEYAYRKSEERRKTVVTGSKRQTLDTCREKWRNSRHSLKGVQSHQSKALLPSISCRGLG